MHEYSPASWYAGGLSVNVKDNLGVASTPTLTALEAILDATRPSFRLTYNQVNSGFYTDFTISSTGILTVAPTGTQLNLGGNTVPTTNNVYALGTAALRWSGIYAGLGDLSARLAVGSTAVTNTAAVGAGSTFAPARLLNVYQAADLTSYSYVAGLVTGLGVNESAAAILGPYSNNCLVNWKLRTGVASSVVTSVTGGATVTAPDAAYQPLYVSTRFRQHAVMAATTAGDVIFEFVDPGETFITHVGPENFFTPFVQLGSAVASFSRISNIRVEYRLTGSATWNILFNAAPIQVGLGFWRGPNLPSTANVTGVRFTFSLLASSSDVRIQEIGWATPYLPQGAANFGMLNAPNNWGQPNTVLATLTGTPLRQVNLAGSPVIAADSQGNLVPGSGAGGAFNFEYKFSSSTATAPNNGFLRFNSAVANATITRMYVAATSNAGRDLTDTLSKIKAGDKLYVQERDDSTKSIGMYAAAVPVDMGTWFDIQVEFVAADSGTLPNNNQICDFWIMHTGQGTGTADYLARWITAFTMGIGTTRDDGAKVSIGGALDPVAILKVYGAGWLTGNLKTDGILTVGLSATVGTTLGVGTTGTFGGMVTATDFTDSNLGTNDVLYSTGGLIQGRSFAAANIPTVPAGGGTPNTISMFGPAPGKTLVDSLLTQEVSGGGSFARWTGNRQFSAIIVDNTGVSGIDPHFVGFAWEDAGKLVYTAYANMTAGSGARDLNFNYFDTAAPTPNQYPMLNFRAANQTVNFPNRPTIDQGANPRGVASLYMTGNPTSMYSVAKFMATDGRMHNSSIIDDGFTIFAGEPLYVNPGVQDIDSIFRLVRPAGVAAKFDLVRMRPPVFPETNPMPVWRWSFGATAGTPATDPMPGGNPTPGFTPNEPGYFYFNRYDAAGVYVGQMFALGPQNLATFNCPVKLTPYQIHSGTSLADFESEAKVFRLSENKGWFGPEWNNNPPASTDSFLLLRLQGITGTDILQCTNTGNFAILCPLEDQGGLHIGKRWTPAPSPLQIGMMVVEQARDTADPDYNQIILTFFELPQPSYAAVPGWESLKSNQIFAVTNKEDILMSRANETESILPPATDRGFFYMNALYSPGGPQAAPTYRGIASAALIFNFHDGAVWGFDPRAGIQHWIRVSGVSGPATVGFVPRMLNQYKVEDSNIQDSTTGTGVNAPPIPTTTLRVAKTWSAASAVSTMSVESTHATSSASQQQGLKVTPLASHTVGTLTALAGVSVDSQTTGVSGTTADQYGFLAYGSIGAGALVTRRYGLRAQALSTGAVGLANYYGVWVDDQGATTQSAAFYSNMGLAATKWGLHLAGQAQNYLRGNLGIGSGASLPTYELDVVGHTRISGSTFKAFLDIPITDTTHNGHWVRLISGNGGLDISGFSSYFSQTKFRFYVLADGAQSNRGQMATVTIVGSRSTDDASIQVEGAGIYNGSTAFITDLRVVKDNTLSGWFVDVFIAAGSILAGKTERLRVELLEGYGVLTSTLDPSLATGTVLLNFNPAQAGVARTYSAWDAWAVTGSMRATESITAVTSVVAGTAITAGTTITASGLITGAGLKDTTLLNKLILGTDTFGQLIARTLLDIGAVGGSGTEFVVPRWDTGGKTLRDSVITDAANLVTIAKNTQVTGTLQVTSTGTFNNVVTISMAADPRLVYMETGAAVDKKRTDWMAQGGAFFGRFYNDALSLSSSWLAVTRMASGYQADTITFTANNGVFSTNLFSAPSLYTTGQVSKTFIGTDATGKIVPASLAGGTATPAAVGTADVLPRWSVGGTFLEDSGVSDDDNTVTVNRRLFWKGSDLVGFSGSSYSEGGWYVMGQSTDASRWYKIATITPAANYGSSGAKLIFEVHCGQLTGTQRTTYHVEMGDRGSVPNPMRYYVNGEGAVRDTGSGIQVYAQTGGAGGSWIYHVYAYTLNGIWSSIYTTVKSTGYARSQVVFFPNATFTETSPATLPNHTLDFDTTTCSLNWSCFGNQLALGVPASVFSIAGTLAVTSTIKGVGLIDDSLKSKPVIGTDSAGRLQAYTIPGGGSNQIPGGLGVANYVARWTDVNILGTGLIRDDNVGVSVGGAAVQSSVLFFIQKLWTTTGSSTFSVLGRADRSVADPSFSNVTFYSQSQISHPTATTQLAYYDYYALPAFTGAGTTTDHYGYRSYVSMNAGTVVNRYGFSVAGASLVGGAVTFETGFRSEDLSAGINRKGFVSQITAGAGTRWNIYSEGTAPNYFNGSIGVGITAPAEKLDVVGNSKISGTISAALLSEVVGFEKNVIFSGTPVLQSWKIAQMPLDSDTSNLTALALDMECEEWSAGGYPGKVHLDIRMSSRGSPAGSGLKVVYNLRGTVVPTVVGIRVYRVGASGPYNVYAYLTQGTYAGFNVRSRAYGFGVKPTLYHTPVDESNPGPVAGTLVWDSATAPQDSSIIGTTPATVVLTVGGKKVAGISGNGTVNILPRWANSSSADLVDSGVSDDSSSIGMIRPLNIIPNPVNSKILNLYNPPATALEISFLRPSDSKPRWTMGVTAGNVPTNNPGNFFFNRYDVNGANGVQMFSLGTDNLATFNCPVVLTPYQIHSGTSLADNESEAEFFRLTGDLGYFGLEWNNNPTRLRMKLVGASNYTILQLGEQGQLSVFSPSAGQGGLFLGKRGVPVPASNQVGYMVVDQSLNELDSQYHSLYFSFAGLPQPPYGVAGWLPLKANQLLVVTNKEDILMSRANSSEDVLPRGTDRGFFYINVVDDVPTGVPTARGNAAVPLIYNKANNSLYGFNGTWRKLGGSFSGSSPITGTGTVPYLPVWVDTDELGTSVIQSKTKGATIGRAVVDFPTSAWMVDSVSSVLVDNLGARQPVLYGQWLRIVDDDTAAINPARTVLYTTYDKTGTATSTTSNNIGITSALNVSNNAARMEYWTGFYSTVALGTVTTVTNFRHMLLDRNRFNYSAGTKAVVSVRHGIYIDDFNTLNNTTLSNNYGIQIVDQTNVLSNNRALDLGILSTGGGTRYNVYAGGSAQNYFLGNVGIGAGRSTPAVALDVTGDITATATVTGSPLKQANLANAQVVGADQFGNLKVSNLNTFDFVGIQDYVARWTDADSLGTGVLRMNAVAMATGTAPIPNVLLYLNWSNTQALDTYGILLNASRSVAYAGANVAYYSGGTLSYPSGGAIQTTYYDFLAAPSFNGTGTTASVFGIRINTSVNAGTVNNRWGIFVTAAAGAGTVDKEYGVGIGVNYVAGQEKWNIYASGTASNYFAGTVSIGNNFDGASTGATTTFVPAQLLNVWKNAADLTGYSPITGVTTGLTMNAESAALLGPFSNNLLANWELRGGTVVTSVTGSATITTIVAAYQPAITTTNRYRSYTTLANPHATLTGTAVYEFTDSTNALITHPTALSGYTPYFVLSNHSNKVTNVKVEYKLGAGVYTTLFDAPPTLINYGVWRGPNLGSTTTVTGIRFTFTLAALTSDCRLLEVGWASYSSTIQGIYTFGALNATNTWGQTQTWIAPVNHFAVTTGNNTVNISGPAASSRVLAWQSLGVDRWKMYATTADDLYLLAYTDAGASGPLTAVFQRSSGSTGLGAVPNSAYRLDISGDTLFRGNATLVGANSNLFRFWSDAVVAPGQLYAMWMSQILSYSISPTPVASDFNIFFRIAGADRGFVFQSGAVANQWNVHMHGSGSTYFRKQVWAEDFVTTNVISAVCLKTDNTGKIQATTFPTLGDIGGVGGSGTVNILPRWDATGKALVNSGVTDDGTNILMSRVLAVNNLHGVFSLSKWKGTGVAENWKIATMMAGVVGNAGLLDIDFAGGYYIGTSRNQIRLIMGNRESTPTISYQIYGISRQTFSGIRIYQEADNTFSIYLYMAGTYQCSFTADYRKSDYLDLGTTLIANPVTVAAPTGTLICDTTSDTPLPPQFSAIGTTATVGGKNLLTMTGNGTVNVLPKWTSSGSSDLTPSGLTDDATRLYVARQLIVNPNPTSSQVLSLVNAPGLASSIYFIRPADSLPRWVFGVTAGNTPVNDPGYFYFNQYKADGTFNNQILALGAGGKAVFNCPVDLIPYEIHSGSSLADGESEAKFFRLSGGQGWFGQEWNNNPQDLRLMLTGTGGTTVLQCNLHGSFAIICPTLNNGGLHLGKRGVATPSAGEIGLLVVEQSRETVDPLYHSIYLTFNAMPPPPYGSVPLWVPLQSNRLLSVTNKEDILMSRANTTESILPINTDRGFFYINAVASAPTGTPTARGGASVPLIYSMADNSLYAYNVTWKKLGGSSGGGGGGPISGVGTQNYLARWDTVTGDSLGNGSIQDAGLGGIGIGIAAPTDAVGRLYRAYAAQTVGYGIVTQANWTGTSAVTQTVTYWSGSVINKTGGSLAFYADYYGAPVFTLAGVTVTDIYGFRSYLTLNSGTVPNRYAFAVQAPNIAGGAITAETGFYCPELSTGVNRYAFRGVVGTGGGTRWNLYMEGAAPNYLNGFLGIKKTVPTVELDVVGSASITANTTIGGTLGVTGTVTAAGMVFAQRFSTTGVPLGLAEPGSLLFRTFGNSFDAFQFSGIISAEEWNGSAWVTHSLPKSTFERLLTGQAHYGGAVNLTGVKPKLRLVLVIPSQTSGGTVSLIQSWTTNGPPSWQAKLEVSTIADFESVATPPLLVMALQYPGGNSTAGNCYTMLWPVSANMAIPGTMYARITLESGGNTPEPTTTSLLSLQLWGSYSTAAAAPTDVSRRAIAIPAQWNYARQTSFDKEVAINTYNPPTGGYALDVIGKQRITDTLISVASQGTAPFSATSTTLCPNLNAFMLNGYQEATLTSFLRGQFNLVGGGTLTATSGGTPPANPVYVKWSARIMMICNGYSALTMGGSYFSISVPAAGTVITVVSAGGNTTTTTTVDGFPLIPAQYDQLYAVLTVGGTASVTDFRIVRHTSPIVVPLEWIRIAASNADAGDMIMWFTGDRTKAGQAIDTTVGQPSAGTLNYLPRFAAGSNLINSAASDDGSIFSVARNSAITGYLTVSNIATISIGSVLGNMLRVGPQFNSTGVSWINQGLRINGALVVHDPLNVADPSAQMSMTVVKATGADFTLPSVTLSYFNFVGAVISRTSDPRLIIYDTDGSKNWKRHDWVIQGNVFNGRFYTDDGETLVTDNWLTIDHLTTDSPLAGNITLKGAGKFLWNTQAVAMYSNATGGAQYAIPRLSTADGHTLVDSAATDNGTTFTIGRATQVNSTLNASGYISALSTTTHAGLIASSANVAAMVAFLDFRTDSKYRWRWQKEQAGANEGTGDAGNAGSDLSLTRWTDAGLLTAGGGGSAYSIFIKRSTGYVRLGSSTAATVQLDVTGDILASATITGAGLFDSSLKGAALVKTNATTGRLEVATVAGSGGVGLPVAGTQYTIPMFTSTTNIGNSHLSENSAGNTLTFAGTGTNTYFSMEPPSGNVGYRWKHGSAERFVLHMDAAATVLGLGAFPASTEINVFTVYRATQIINFTNRPTIGLPAKNVVSLTATGSTASINYLPRFSSTDGSIQNSGVVDDGYGIYCTQPLYINPGLDQDRMFILANPTDKAMRILFNKDNTPGGQTRWEIGVTAGIESGASRTPGSFRFTWYDTQSPYTATTVLYLGNAATFNCPVTLTPYELRAGTLVAESYAVAEFFRLEDSASWFGPEWNNNPELLHLKLTGWNGNTVLKCSQAGVFSIGCPLMSQGGLVIYRRGVPTPASIDGASFITERTLNMPATQYMSLFVSFGAFPDPPYGSVPGWFPMNYDRVFTVTNQEDILMSRGNDQETPLPQGTDRGFFYINAITSNPGSVPTGTPTPRGTGTVPLILNRKDYSLYGHNGSAWVKLGGTGSGGTNPPMGGTGTAGYVSKWTAADTQGNSLIQDNGTAVSIGAAVDNTATFLVNRTSTGAFQTQALLLRNNRTIAEVGSVNLGVYVSSTLSYSAGVVQPWYIDFYGYSSFTGTGVTSAAMGFRAVVAVATGKINTRTGFEVYPAILTTGGTVDNERGFNCIDLSVSAGPEVRYGFKSSVSVGTGNRWNFHADGTAPNYFNGNIGIKKAVPTVELDVVGAAAITGLTTSGGFRDTTILGSSCIQADITGRFLKSTELDELMATTVPAGAIQFDGTFGKYAEGSVPNTTIGTGDYSIVCVFRCVAAPYASINGGLFAVGGTAGGTPGPGEVMAYAAAGNAGWVVGVRDQVQALTTAAINLAPYYNQIIQLAVVRTSGVMTVYVDGTQIAFTPPVTQTQSLSATNMVVRLGNIHTGVHSYRECIYNLQVYNRAMTATELRDLKREGVASDDRNASMAEMLLNGDFATDTIWSKGTGVTISGGTLNISAAVQTQCIQNVASTKGIMNKRFRAKVFATITSGSGSMHFGGSSLGKPLVHNTTTVHEAIWTGTQVSFYCPYVTSAFVGSLDNASLIAIGCLIDVDCGVGYGTTLPDVQQRYPVVIPAGSAAYFQHIRESSSPQYGSGVVNTIPRRDVDGLSLVDSGLVDNGTLISTTRTGGITASAGGIVGTTLRASTLGAQAYLYSDASGNILGRTTAAGGIINGGGTAPAETPPGSGYMASYLPIFTAATSIGNSSVTQEYHAGSSGSILRFFANSYFGVIAADASTADTATGYQWAQNRLPRFTAYLSGSDAAREMIWTSFNALGTIGTPFLKFGNDGTFNFLKVSPAAPFTVASSVVVAGLNTDLWDGLHESTYTAYRNAAHSLQGGGVLSVNSAGAINWNQRIIAIGQGRGAHWAGGGFFDIQFPSNGAVVTGHGGAVNYTVINSVIPLAAWQVLYYELPLPGGASNSASDRFRIVYFTPDTTFVVPYNWVLIAQRLGEYGLPVVWFNKERLFVNQSVDTNAVGAKLYGGGSASSATNPAINSLPMYVGTGSAVNSLGDSFLAQEDNSSSVAGLLRFKSNRNYSVIIADAFTDATTQVGFQWAQAGLPRYTAYTDGTTARDLIWKRFDLAGTTGSIYQIHRWNGEVVSYNPFQSISPVSFPTTGFYQTMWRDVAWYDAGAAGITGALVLKINTTSLNRMFNITIKGYWHGNDVGAFELLLGGYASGGTWTATTTSARWTGNLPAGTGTTGFSQIEFRGNGTNEAAIVLGTNTTSWAWIRVVVSEMQISHIVLPSTGLDTLVGKVSFVTSQTVSTTWPTLVSPTYPITKDFTKSAGAANYGARWTAADTLGIGIIQDNGVGVGIGGGVSASAGLAVTRDYSSGTGELYALQVNNTISYAAAGLINSIRVNPVAANGASTAVASLSGVLVYAQQTGAGSTTNQYGFYAGCNISAGSVGTRYGFLAAAAGGGATGITNNYGFHASNQDAVTLTAAFSSDMAVSAGKKYGVYISGDAQNWFRGALGVGTGKNAITAGVVLDVSGAAAVTSLAAATQVSVAPNGAYWFWGLSTYKMDMAVAATSGIVKGSYLPSSSLTASDYNMFFEMGGGVNRGFVWKNASISSADALMQLHPSIGLFLKDGVHTFKPNSGRFSTTAIDSPIIWRNVTAWLGPNTATTGAVIIRINSAYSQKLINLKIVGHNHTAGGGIFEITAGGYTNQSSPYWGGSPKISWGMNLAPTGATELKRIRLARHSSGDWGIVLGQVVGESGGATSWTYGRAAVSEMLVSPLNGLDGTPEPSQYFSASLVTDFTGWAFEAASDADVTMVKPAISAVSVTGTNSVRHTGTNNVVLDLVNDVASPGVNKYYGTDGSGGQKNWYPLPTGTGTSFYYRGTLIGKSTTTVLSTNEKRVVTVSFTPPGYTLQDGDTIILSPAAAGTGNITLSGGGMVALVAKYASSTSFTVQLWWTAGGTSGNVLMDYVITVFRSTSSLFLVRGKVRGELPYTTTWPVDSINTVTILDAALAPLGYVVNDNDTILISPVAAANLLPDEITVVPGVFNVQGVNASVGTPNGSLQIGLWNTTLGTTIDTTGKVLAVMISVIRGMS